MKRACLVSLSLSLLLLGCPKKEGGGGGGGDTPAADAGPPTTSDAAMAQVQVEAGIRGEPKAGEARTWAVKYSITAAPMYVPDSKDWSNVKFKNEESKYLGDGTFTLSVDSSGRVTGTSEGDPLGHATIDGQLEGTSLTGNVRRTNPEDLGLTGTLIGTVKGDAVEGEMKLADTNASAVRKATFSGTLQKK